MEGQNFFVYANENERMFVLVVHSYILYLWIHNWKQTWSSRIKGQTMGSGGEAPRRRKQ